MTQLLATASRSTYLPRHEPGECIGFDAFELFPTARVLKRYGMPLPLGSRALDILVVLVGRAGQVVSHRELISKAWRGLVVDQGNLRVQINGLRKVLGEGAAGARYIANVPGQGYCFVAAVERFGASGPTVLPPLDYALR
ncbi:winged helix-turn-helix domain-containing protein [Steroidobacter agaridevorans]|uniref:winged helix-turn-helix domain-containing protein n=1 Tax=Steroidobacter agaridevorans TaxID=2695856 RepID=UPI001328DAE6|nr:transcriptional regulator [Steroidobacter agaridevorans]GFE88525.1 hypothetical protein GCM10011488_34790 [Steroidobacter agaridevorans]